MTSSLRSRLRRAAMALSAVGVAFAASLVVHPTAQADPIFPNSLHGFGSEFTQDIGNAFAGFNNGIFYIPVNAGPGGGYATTSSWDATPAGQCITTKFGSPPILRPTGSLSGLRLISRSFGGGTWPPGTGNPCGHRNVSGLVDFVRSSIGPSAPGTPLTYIPFGRDAIGWAYSKPSGSPVVNLTLAQLTSLHQSGPQLIGGTVIIPCGIQTPTGTYQTWMRALGISVSPLGQDAGTAFCNTVLAPGGVPDAGGRLSENVGTQLAVKANALATLADPICDGVPGGLLVECGNAQVIVGFSATQFIARSNGVAAPAPGPGVKMGQIGGIDPISGVAPNLTPSPAYFGSTTLARDAYNVVSTEALQPPADARLVNIFAGPTSAVCLATTTIQRFGFLPAANCGDLTLTGPFIT